jgi:hypothetical protein
MSWWYYDLSVYTIISAPCQPLADMCPLLRSASSSMPSGVGGLRCDFLLTRKPPLVYALLGLQRDHDPSAELASTCKKNKGVVEVMSNDESLRAEWDFIVGLSVALGPHPQQSALHILKVPIISWEESSNLIFFLHIFRRNFNQVGNSKFG